MRHARHVISPARATSGLALALILAMSAGAGAAVRLPRLLTGWDGRYSVRPTSIYYTGDGSGVIGELRRRGGLTGPGRGFLHWRTWTRQRAVGRGTLWVKLGTPTATSPFTRLTVSLTASRVRGGVFRRLTLHYRLHGRRVTDVRCLPDGAAPGRTAGWAVLILGRCG